MSITSDRQPTTYQSNNSARAHLGKLMSLVGLLTGAGEELPTGAGTIQGHLHLQKAPPPNPPTPPSMGDDHECCQSAALWIAFKHLCRSVSNPGGLAGQRVSPAGLSLLPRKLFTASGTLERGLGNLVGLGFPSPVRFVYSWNLRAFLSLHRRERFILEEIAQGHFDLLHGAA